MAFEKVEIGPLLAPFPYFGGKLSVADIVWARFGKVPNYIEPFFGSGAVLLNRPMPFDGVETVNDKDGMIANFWRAVANNPDEVAHYADWPVNENDLHARHAWLVERKHSLQATMEGNPDYYDAKIAGWWCWGVCCWIGSGFCSGRGPWAVREVEGVRQLVNLGNAGRGVNRKRVHLSNAGMGVNRKLVNLGDAGRGGLYCWMDSLAKRLYRVRVCCGDWTRVCGGRSGDSLQHFFASGQLCAVFLDPPYADTANRTDKLYSYDDLDVAHAVRDWAVEHGNDPRLRICLAGYDGEHEMPGDWEVVEWKAQGGYARIADGDTQGKANRHSERLWFIPNCLKATAQDAQLFE